jgi:cobyric acid synthase CobQ
MGRAQVVQAQAAKIDPDVRMNPVLLKPNSDLGSQVILCGKPVGNMSVLEYVAYKEQVWGKVCGCFDELHTEYDAVILEGAGSPGEINLKAHDIVNMRMAQYAKSPVLLVGDIDRGGVYASFIGTMEVLSEWERRLVAGFLVNRFRGQASLLDSAHDYVHEFTKRKIMGVIPYIHDHGIPEEDSVSFKEGLFAGKKPQGEYVEIALINLPHISNFTDIEPFIGEPDVYLHIVDKPDALGRPDAIIIPGSKNVIADLSFLHTSGLAWAIKKQAGRSEIIGICGGYQMLGGMICDPHGIESNCLQKEGLQLLDMVTTLEQQKQLTRQQGVHLLSGCKIYGYEIHHGQTGSLYPPVLNFDDGKSCGAMHQQGLIWGSYLHGIFDADTFRRWFIDELRVRAGFSALKTVQVSYDLESSFARLAAIVRENIDMAAVYRLLQLA